MLHIGLEIYYKWSLKVKNNAKPVICSINNNNNANIRIYITSLCHSSRGWWSRFSLIWGVRCYAAGFVQCPLLTLPTLRPVNKCSVLTSSKINVCHDINCTVGLLHCYNAEPVTYCMMAVLHVRLWLLYMQGSHTSWAFVLQGQRAGKCFWSWKVFRIMSVALNLILHKMHYSKIILGVSVKSALQH